MRSPLGGTGDLPPAIAGLLASLPRNGQGWTEAQRKRFVTTFEAVLDFAIPIREVEPIAEGREDDE